MSSNHVLLEQTCRYQIRNYSLLPACSAGWFCLYLNSLSGASIMAVSIGPRACARVSAYPS